MTLWDYRPLRPISVIISRVENESQKSPCHENGALKCEIFQGGPFLFLPLGEGLILGRVLFGTFWVVWVPV